jgi:hypothetical protein
MTKSPEMEQFLEGLGANRSESLANAKLRCVDPPFGCGREIQPLEYDLWDELTQREAGISGMCSDCQDEVFGDGSCCGEDCCG